jgi:cyclopropane-fatty-acyl-phospholipid synthase
LLHFTGWWDSEDPIEVLRAIGWNADVRSMTGVITGLHERLKLAQNQQTRKKSHKVAEVHYDLGNDLYQNMLDPTMNYTCAYWKNATTLEQAQINKMDLIARKLKLKPGMRVLDIGSGFGAMAKYLAQNYKVSVVGYNSELRAVQCSKEFLASCSLASFLSHFICVFRTSFVLL